MEMAFIDNFSRLKKVYTQHMEPVCQKWNLTQNELAVLIFLHDHPDFDRAVDLVNYCGMVKSHASKSVNHLEKMGYLERQTDENDRRTVHLQITRAAGSLVAEAVQIHDVFLDRLLRGISREEKRVYQIISMKIAENLTNLEE